MKSSKLINISSILLTAFSLSACVATKSVDGVENVREIKAERVFQHPIETVWSTFFERFDEGYKFNPNWVDSGWINGSKKAEVGAERFMQADQSGKQMFYERITYFDQEEKKLRFEIYDAKGVPLDTSAAFGESNLFKIDDETTRFEISFYYRTTPRFLGNFVHKRLVNDFDEMTIAMEHFINTNEIVTKENFNEIAKLY